MTMLSSMSPSAPVTQTINNGNIGINTDTSGRNVQALQPRFIASTSALLNVTGDATVYTTIFDTATINIGTIYSTSTGLLTAPVTGDYQVNALVETLQIGAAFTGKDIYFLQAGSAATKYYIAFSDALDSALATSFQYAGSHLIRLVAGDTLALVVKISGSTKTADIGANSRWSAWLQG